MPLRMRALSEMLRLQIMANFGHSLSQCMPGTLLAVLIKAETLFDLAALLHCARSFEAEDVGCKEFV